VNCYPGCAARPWALMFCPCRAKELNAVGVCRDTIYNVAWRFKFLGCATRPWAMMFCTVGAKDKVSPVFDLLHIKRITLKARPHVIRAPRWGSRNCFHEPTPGAMPLAIAGWAVSTATIINTINDHSGISGRRPGHDRGLSSLLPSGTQLCEPGTGQVRRSKYGGCRYAQSGEILAMNR
jgi:hypothetical protein